MKMDDENRKKLERFWRRKLWLGLAAVGAIGLAAWRVSAVQGRYDDVLVQESRELPEKVYQELVAEVRKGVPILPQHTSVSDLPSYHRVRTRCDYILALGVLRDSRSIPELGTLLNDDINRVRSCRHQRVYHMNSQDMSAYGAVVSALGEFGESDAHNYLKKALSKLPSPEAISIWREFHKRGIAAEKDFYKNELSVENKINKYDIQMIPPFVNSPELDQKNKSVIQSLTGKDPSYIQVENLRRILDQEHIPKWQKEKVKEELFKLYYVRYIFKHQNAYFGPAKILPLGNSRPLKVIEHSLNESYFLSLVDSANNSNPRARKESYFRTAPAFISILKSLNHSKDFPLEDWIGEEFGRLDNPNLNNIPTPLLQAVRSTFSKYPQLTPRSSALKALEILFDRNSMSGADRQAAIPVLMALYKNYNKPSDVIQRANVVRLIRKLNESEKVDRTAQQHTQQLFYLETGVLGAIGVTAIGLLLSSIRLRNPFSLFFSTYLLFPEEVVAELIALKQRRQSEKVAKWQIRLELAYEIITLVWAFQIQIRIDDRKLPPGGNRSAK